MNILFSIDALNKMTPDELEGLRDSGLPERQRMTDCVIAALNIPDGWSITGEWQNEFGGLFPVQCRLTPDLNKPLTLSLCSPGDVSPMWVVVIQAHPAQRVWVLYAAEEFYPESLSDLLERVDSLLRDGRSAHAIADAFGGGVIW
ncbi:conjugation system SOS inhibitor PsiB [Pectobacterium aroidearum]|uniref:conjugation system SOS inhibitor PsiB n=1 Tax=Pectobacterium aroidearum TaxID=1201031 RepID=UPI003019ED1D